MVFSRRLVLDAGDVGLLQLFLGSADMCIGACSEKIESHGNLLMKKKPHVRNEKQFDSTRKIRLRKSRFKNLLFSLSRVIL